MRFEVHAKEYGLWVYDDDADPDNWCASAIVQVYGDRAWISCISSPLLFKALPEHLVAFMDKIGVVTLEGYMTPAMARALRLKCRGFANFEITHTGKTFRGELPWVIITPLR